jgi:hypothetical protein
VAQLTFKAAVRPGGERNDFAVTVNDGPGRQQNDL